MPLSAGAAEVKITPPVGFPLAGYGSREKGSESIDDELYAKALVLGDGDTRIAIVTTDLISVPKRLVAKIRQEVREHCGIPESQVMVCASHTHFGPTLAKVSHLTEEAQKGFDADYVEGLVGLIAGVVRSADANRREARLSYGVGSAKGLNFNRRTKRPDGKVEMSFRPPVGEEAEGLTIGPTDPDVSVLRAEGLDGSCVATVASFSSHPVCGVDRLYAISADYPGYVMKVVETATGGPCLFARGCAGNLVPAEREGTARKRIGAAVGAEAVKVSQELRPCSDAPLQVLTERVELPLRPLPTLEEAREQIVECERRLAEWQDVDAPPEEIQNPRGDLVYAMHSLGLVEETKGSSTVATELQVIRIGGLTMVCLPGENFVETGLAIKQECPDTFVFDLCNDTLDYVPIAPAYEEGGYEPVWTRLAPGAGEKLRDAALGAVKKLRD